MEEVIAATSFLFFIRINNELFLMFFILRKVILFYLVQDMNVYVYTRWKN